MLRRASVLSAIFLTAVACHSSSSPGTHTPGQTTFLSAPPGSNGGTLHSGASGAPTAAGSAQNSSSGSSARTVAETDIYRVDGNRLYYLNGYRGLMVFDISTIDAPKLLGRSAIYGSPVDMIVKNGVASVVVADWYGTAPDGSPFYGSIVRTIDATDPTNMKILGDAQLGGWVRDDRVVGDVLYAVSEDYGITYGFATPGIASGGVASAGSGVAVGGWGYTQAKVIVSSVNIAGGAVATGKQEFSGWGGVMNVTPNAIMLAYPEVKDPSQQDGTPTGNTVLQYVDISDPQGTIKLRGSLTVHGAVEGWGTDNGRWNIDFADQQYAHAIGCAGMYCDGSGYVVSTVDFTNPDGPKLASELMVSATGWLPAARFDSDRLYLAPDSSYYAGASGTTPIQIYDLTDPANPKLAGETTIAGSVWNFTPSGNQIFALGSSSVTGMDTSVSLSYLDVTDATKPALLGTATFGNGWAWTPAADTFKAFTRNDTLGLVVLPFSGWDSTTDAYNNGLQLISYTPTSIQTAGTAHTKGWVERGIFANGRLLSLSDLSLGVVDVTDVNHPSVTSELTLARDVVDANPNGTTVAELSDSDWWGNDLSSSELRVLPLSNASETTDTVAADLQITGVNPRQFSNGNFSYVVTDVRTPTSCSSGGPATGGLPPGPQPTCYSWTQQVQVVDLSNGTAVLRGSVSLPQDDGYAYYWGGWEGFYPWDWYNGADVVQVGGDALAFRRWEPDLVPSTGNSSGPTSALYVVDLSNPDKPTLASTTVTQNDTDWWGNVRAIGNTLYTTHYVSTTVSGSSLQYVQYFLDSVDLTDRAHPRIGSSVNVPGILVGASSADPSILYFIDYTWNGSNLANSLSVAQLSGGTATLLGSVEIDGWVGNVFVAGTTAYLSAQQYSYNSHASSSPSVSLHQIDLSNPASPVDSSSAAQSGWGWLLGVEGDRAIITSGWSDAGVDLYKLMPGQPPTFDQFVRTNGWWASSLARQGNQLFLSSGEWGVQVISLQ